jgi:ubiquitin-conjugating enzyme E2 D/E
LAPEIATCTQPRKPNNAISCDYRYFPKTVLVAVTKDFRSSITPKDLGTNSKSDLLLSRPNTVVDIFSLPVMEGTVNSQETAPEDAGSHRDVPSTSMTQNSRVMNDLLANVGLETRGSSYPGKMDISKVGHLIKGLSFTTFDSTMASYVPLLHHTLTHGSQATTRARKELRNSQQDALTTVPRWYNVHSVDLRHILGSFEGPIDSPFEGGIFHLVIRLHDEYPMRPPRCRMLTKIYHPNINSQGEICLNILGTEWSPCLVIHRVLMIIASLLDNPGLEDPLVPEIAETYCRDRRAYEENARVHTKRYANEVELTAETAKRFVEVCEEFAR